MGLLERTQKLLSVSAYSGRNTYKTSPSAAQVEAVRKMLGGNLLPPIQTKLEWYPQEVDNASYQADLGNLTHAGRLKRAYMRDPLISGLAATKYGGICRLPIKRYGSQVVWDSLESKDGGIRRFDLFLPPSEIKAMAEDGDQIGVSVAEILPVDGREYGVLERKDPEYLMYRWGDNTWHLRTNTGLEQVVPGNGRWVLHVQGPRIAPWATSRWHSLGRNWVRKDSCLHLQSNYSFKLANAARVAVSPRGAAKAARHNWFRQVAAWGINTVFQVDEGWDVRLIESNGNGTEIYTDIIKNSDENAMICLVGNLTQVTGGSGFSSDDLYGSVRHDLVEDCATPLAYTLSTQALTVYTYDLFPEEYDDSAGFQFDVQRPQDLTASAAIYTALGAGIDALQDAAAKGGLEIDVKEEFRKFGILSRPISEEQKTRIRDAVDGGLLKEAPESAQRQAAILYSLGRALERRRAA